MSKPRRLTDDELYGLYLDMDGCEFDSDTRADVIEEMRQVVDARSHRAGGEVIEWWGGWDQWQATETPIAWAREYRRKAAGVVEGDVDAERAER